MSDEYAFATLVLTEDYLPGAVVLAQTLHSHPLLVLASNELPASVIRQLESLYDDVVLMKPITSPNTEKLRLLGRRDLAETFTKIYLWKQTQYKKIVYLDADTLPLKSLDDLFDLDFQFAASPDCGWPDMFNSGVLLLKPCKHTFDELLKLALAGETIDGGDQGLLNLYFKDWHRLSFAYNVTFSSNYQYAPAVQHFRDQIRLVHFIGVQKPWHTYPRPTSSFYDEMVNHWWRQYEMACADKQLPNLLSKISLAPTLESASEHGILEQEQEQEQEFEPPLAPWRGELQPPPVTSTGEAVFLERRRYQNTWDVNNAPDIQRTPEALIQENEQYNSVIGEPVPTGEPDNDNIKSQDPGYSFPWEKNAPPPTREFKE